MNMSWRNLEAEGRSRSVGEEQAAGVTVLLARAVRHAGASQSATAVATTQTQRDARKRIG